MSRAFPSLPMSVKTGKLSLRYRQFRRSSVVSDCSISSRLFHSRAYIPFILILNFSQLAHCFLYVCSCSSIHPMPFYYCVFSLWHHTEVQYAIIEAGVQCRGLFCGGSSHPWVERLDRIRNLLQETL